MQLKGKVAIVTGGAGGLGRALVEALLQQGCLVHIFDTHAERGTEVEKTLRTKSGEDRLWFHVTDVSSEKSFTDSFEAVVNKHGNVDIMVNNAAIMNEQGDIDKVILTNLGEDRIGNGSVKDPFPSELCPTIYGGVIRGSNLAIKHMRKDQGGKGGVIININSNTTQSPMPSIPVYGSTRWGVCGFTKSWAANPNLKEMGLRFGQICPWAFQSFMLEQSGETQLLYPKLFWDTVKEGGILDVQDIAKSFIHVLEDDNSNDVMLYLHPKFGAQKKRIEAVEV